jgi:hypothetical protein
VLFSTSPYPVPTSGLKNPSQLIKNVAILLIATQNRKAPNNIDSPRSGYAEAAESNERLSERMKSVEL